LLKKIFDAVQSDDDHFRCTMTYLYKRLGEDGKRWKCIFKALLVLEYLITNGSEKVIRETLNPENRVEIQTLTLFQSTSEFDGKDVGGHVRDKAKEIVEYLEKYEMRLTHGGQSFQTSGAYQTDSLQRNSQSDGQVIF
jgi:epsin